MSSANKEGYDFALEKAWADQSINYYATPVKSSLSEFRSKLSFEFFKEVYERDLERFSDARLTFKGHYIYAVDGSDLDLPASEDVLARGYRGSPWSKEYETHYPKMYVSHAYDVLNSIICDFRQSKNYSEKALALAMLEGFEQNSLTIYDRLYCSYPFFKKHIELGKYFLARAKCDGDRVPYAVRDFLATRKWDADGEWKPKSIKKEDALKVRYIKVKHPKTKATSVYVTNAPRELFSRQDLENIYQKRWEIEASFKDVVDTLKMDQWHSKKVNGILQEIYCLLWLVNAVKMQMGAFSDPEEEIFAKTYQKGNFKLCVTLVIKNLRLLVAGQVRKMMDLLEHWVRRTRANRQHHSRNYPRAVRRYGTGFAAINKTPRRPASP